MKKFYFALTNKCNRTCKFCSCFSRPNKTTFLSFDVVKEYIDSYDKEFEIQLEGGEPTLHENFFDIIQYAINTGRCARVVLTSNFATQTLDSIESFLQKMNGNTQFTIKPSVNYELYKEEPDIFFKKMVVVKECVDKLENFDITYNVRLDKTETDEIITSNLNDNNLFELSNVFYYQRYGYAANEEKFELPFVIDNPVDFHLISPDGIDFNMDLIKRSEHMRNMK